MQMGPASSSLSARSPLVLLADPSADNREMYATCLKAAGFAVHEASAGPDALEKIKTLMPDVLVADIVLPGMDAFALADVLRSDETTALVPVVVVTGYIQPDLLSRAAAVGIDSILLKPCDPPVLVEEIRMVLEACERLRHSTRRPERRNVRRRHADVLRERAAGLYSSAPFNQSV